RTVHDGQGLRRRLPDQPTVGRRKRADVHARRRAACARLRGHGPDTRQGHPGPRRGAHAPAAARPAGVVASRRLAGHQAVHGDRREWQPAPARPAEGERGGGGAQVLQQDP
ncbi:unnamed protein product, partial [Prorocentrum cordatum]